MRLFLWFSNTVKRVVVAVKINTAVCKVKVGCRVTFCLNFWKFAPLHHCQRWTSFIKAQTQISRWWGDPSFFVYSDDVISNSWWDWLKAWHNLTVAIFKKEHLEKLIDCSKKICLGPKKWALTSLSHLFISGFNSCFLNHFSLRSSTLLSAFTLVFLVWVQLKLKLQHLKAFKFANNISVIITMYYQRSRKKNKDWNLKSSRRTQSADCNKQEDLIENSDDQKLTNDQVEQLLNGIRSRSSSRPPPPKATPPPLPKVEFWRQNSNVVTSLFCNFRLSLTTSLEKNVWQNSWNISQFFSQGTKIRVVSSR